MKSLSSSHLLLGSVLVLSLGSLSTSYLINPILELPTNCYSNSQCNNTMGATLNNTFCNVFRSRCQCNFGYMPGHFKRGAAQQIICTPLACSSDLHCSSIFGDKAVCSEQYRNCTCAPGYSIASENQVCVQTSSVISIQVLPVPIRPIVPVVPELPPAPKVAPIDGGCGWNHLGCGTNATCWFGKCMCPVGFRAENSFNCTKIDCTFNSDCTVWEPNTYCSINLDSRLNKCVCLYGPDFTSQKCAAKPFVPSYDTGNDFSSFAASYVFIMIFVFLIAIIATVVKRNRIANRKPTRGLMAAANAQQNRHHHHHHAPKYIPPPPYMPSR